jgi:hypothetical protein
VLFVTKKKGQLHGCSLMGLVLIKVSRGLLVWGLQARRVHALRSG